MRTISQKLSGFLIGRIFNILTDFLKTLYAFTIIEILSIPAKRMNFEQLFVDYFKDPEHLLYPARC